jgi:hypothetical protein
MRLSDLPRRTVRLLGIGGMSDEERRQAKNAKAEQWRQRNREKRNAADRRRRAMA